jgi:hypothetical protein
MRRDEREAEMWQEIDVLRAENARLRAEIRALKSRPVPPSPSSQVVLGLAHRVVDDIAQRSGGAHGDRVDPRAV